MWTITVDLCFADAEYPEVVEGENAAIVGGCGSYGLSGEVGPWSEEYLADLDICASQGVSRSTVSSSAGRMG